MSTSSSKPGFREAGFSLIELLVGLSLTLVVAMAALALWEGLERSGAEAGDRMVRLIQGRVAVARLSRDLRLASAQGCPFVVSGALLEASSDHVVLLTRSGDSGDLLIVEWELVAGRLMRRRGSCPADRPATITHSLFVDNKTMIEDLSPGSRFRFFASGVEVGNPVNTGYLAAVDEVRLDARAGEAGRRTLVDVAGRSPLGRGR
jgi:prepilin-type N-terminal cleavage/methylation domain-containing protein